MLATLDVIEQDRRHRIELSPSERRVCCSKEKERIEIERDCIHASESRAAMKREMFDGSPTHLGASEDPMQSGH